MIRFRRRPAALLLAAVLLATPTVAACQPTGQREDCDAEDRRNHEPECRDSHRTTKHKTHKPKSRTKSRSRR